MANFQNLILLTRGGRLVNCLPIDFDIQALTFLDLCFCGETAQLLRSFVEMLASVFCGN